MLETNKVWNMDCMELMSLMPNESVSLILTDPPYGISYRNNFSHCKRPFICGDNGMDYEIFAAESFRILKNNSHAYFFTRFDCYPWHYDCLTKAGFTVKNCLVVEKGTVCGIGDLKGSFANNSEWVIFCHKGRRVFNHTTLLKNKKPAGVFYDKRKNPSMEYKTRFCSCWFGNDYPKATCNSTFQKKTGFYHPTIKNSTFLSWLIQISSDPKDIVFDGFMGSGSTAEATLLTDRRFIGAEIDPKYYAMTLTRIEKAAAKNNIYKGEIL